MAIIGARQVGKTTLANQIAGKGRFRGVTRFDLESPRDQARLADPLCPLFTGLKCPVFSSTWPVQYQAACLSEM